MHEPQAMFPPHNQKLVISITVSFFFFSSNELLSYNSVENFLIYLNIFLFLESFSRTSDERNKCNDP